MKRILTCCAAALGLALLWAGSANAGLLEDFGPTGPSIDKILDDAKYAPDNTVRSAAGYEVAGAKAWVANLVTRLTQLGALLAIAGIVYSGFLMVTSGGDDEKAKNGKTGLIWSAAGFAVMVLAATSVNAIVNLFYQTSAEAVK